MSEHPATQQLYRQLREARLTGNNAAALDILRQILALDPADKEAAAQISGLVAASAPAAGSAQASRDNAMTRELYRKWRSACLTHNDLEAFDLLCQILDIDPQNNDAQQQKKETGKRLSHVYAADLEQLLEEGNVSSISSRVAQLRRYAEESYLHELDGFAAAASIADAELRKQHREEADARFRQLAATSGTEERYRLAHDINRFVSECSVSLSTEEQQTLDECESLWNELLHRQKLLQAIDRESQALDQLEDKVARNQELEACFQQLEERCAAAAGLTELPEGEALLARAKKLRRRAQARIKTTQRSRAALQKIRLICMLALISLAGITAFAYVSVEDTCKELNELRLQKNPQELEESLKIYECLTFFYTSISANYAAEKRLCEQYLSEWHRGLKRINELTQEIHQACGKVSEKTLIHDSELIATLNLHMETMRERYNTPPLDSEKKQLIDQLSGEIVGRAREVIKSYQTPRTCKTFAQLGEELARLKNLLDMLPEPIAFNESEKTQAILQFRQCARAIFSQLYQGSPQGVAAYDQFLAPYEEMLALKPELEKTASLSSTFDNLPQQLAACRDLKSYIATLESCAPFFSPGSGYVNLDELKQWVEHADKAAQRQAMKKQLESVGKASLLNDHHLDELDKISGVYDRGESLFPASRPPAVNSVIDKMTAPDTEGNWPEKIDSATYKGKVYMGSAYKINDKRLFRELKTQKKLELPYTATVTTYKMKDARYKVGMKRMELQCGLVLPATLLRHIAMLPDSSIPPLAKAYLYGLAVDMGECLQNPLLSGSAFSKNMTDDIKRYKKLAAESKIAEGTWMLEHPESQDAAWKKFFREAARHDYKTEIAAGIRNILSSHCVYAGYVDTNGNAVMTTQTSQKKRYIPSGSGLEEYHPGRAKPFTPIILLP